MESDTEADGHALREAASAARALSAEATGFGEAIEDAGQRLNFAWTGTRRHEPATAVSCAAEAVRKISEGTARLHRAAACLEEAEGGLTWP